MNIGDKIPERLGVDENGKEWLTSMLHGENWILYFYPKDNTSGCTAQACSLRDGMATIAEKGYKIIGVSKDTASSHLRFKDKYQLPFPLIADTDRSLHEAMGVLYPKKMYGKDVIGTRRTTFFIDPNGVIVAKLEGKEISTAEHAAQVLETIQKLQR